MQFRNSIEIILGINQILHNYNNKNIDIKFSVHDSFLEQLSSGTGTLKIERLESQII